VDIYDCYHFEVFFKWTYVLDPGILEKKVLYKNLNSYIKCVTFEIEVIKKRVKNREEK